MMYEINKTYIGKFEDKFIEIHLNRTSNVHLKTDSNSYESIFCEVLAGFGLFTIPTVYQVYF